MVKWPTLGAYAFLLLSGVRLLVCEESCDARGLGWRDIRKEALVLGVVTLNDLLIVADAVLSF